MHMLDVSHWEKDDKRQASGTRQKFWLVSSHNQKRYLFKISKENTGEAWAEVVASKLGEFIGISTMKAHLASYHGLTGCLLENFVVANAEFYEGGDLFFTIAEDFDRHNLNYYDFSNIIKVLSPFELDRAFVQIPVFDAFIANQDRHRPDFQKILNAYGLSNDYTNMDLLRATGGRLATDTYEFVPPIIPSFYSEFMFRFIEKNGETYKASIQHIHPKANPQLKVNICVCGTLTPTMKQLQQDKLHDMELVIA